MYKNYNRMGYRLRKVLKAKPLKNIWETDAIFENIKEKDQQAESIGNVRRLSMDCKAVVKIGDFSRGGQTRGDSGACDHDFGCKEKYIPCGIVDEDSGRLHICFGNSYKTGDFIVDTLESRWSDPDIQEKQITDRIQLKVDNGLESGGARTRFLNRMVSFSNKIANLFSCFIIRHIIADIIRLNVVREHLKITGTAQSITDAETMLRQAGGMTWKGLNQVIKVSKKIYEIRFCPNGIF